MNTKYPALVLNKVSFPFAGRWLKTTSWQPHGLLHPKRNPNPGMSWSVRERWNDSRVSIWTKPILDEEDVPWEKKGAVMADSLNSRQNWMLWHKPSVSSVEVEQKRLLANVQGWFRWWKEKQITLCTNYMVTFTNERVEIWNVQILQT